MKRPVVSLPVPPSRRPAALPRAVLAAVLAGALALGGCVPLTPYAEARAAAAEGHFVEVGGQAVHVVDRPGGGEAVVFLHGFGASSYSWRLVTARLPGHRTVALDLRGFGYTERPPGIEPYTRDGQVEMVLGVMDRLGIERAHLVGHSYGGALAAALAVLHPERVRSLALVSSAHPDYPQLRRRKIAGVQPLTELFVRVRPLRERSIRRALERSIADDALVTPELVEAYLERLKIEHAPRAYYGITAPAPEPDRTVGLEEVAAPTLVVWGEEDALIPIENGRRATDRVPCHRFVALPGVGHMPMEERPVELAGLLREHFEAPARVCDRSGEVRREAGEK